MTAAHHHHPKPHYSKAQERQYKWIKKHYPFRHPAVHTIQSPRALRAEEHKKAEEERRKKAEDHKKAEEERKKREEEKKRSAPGMVLSTGWITAGNEELPDCAAVAAANTLLAATGIRAADSDVLRLHHLADGSIAGVLKALAAYGLAGHRPAGFWRCGPGLNGLPVIAGLTDGASDHAVARTPAGLISWGGPLGGALLATWMPDGEYWAIAWPG